MASLASADLLRLATAGSVDDGKSTLIGRLLLDAKQVLTDQLEHVEEASRRRGAGMIDLSLLVDGLRAEREQGITIDVAYRYFATGRRTFIIADTPGHVQYTRNMVTGASTADLAVILVDARKGVLEQSKRHAFISSLLGIGHLVVAVNKMDLVAYDEEVFDGIVRDFSDFARGLAGVRDIVYVPISAKLGDNVVDASQHMPWYGGTPLLEHLETVEVADARNLDEARFPVQWVIREHAGDYRGYAGQLAGGVLRPGDEVLVLPSGQTTRIARIDTYDGPARGGRRRDVGHASARGRARRLARGHHLPRRVSAAALARARGDRLLDDRRAAARRRALRDQARHARRARSRRGGRRPRRRAHARAGRGRNAARPQRHRARAPAHVQADGLRPLRAQPRHGVVHPHRRVDERHRRCWHDPLSAYHLPVLQAGRSDARAPPPTQARQTFHYHVLIRHMSVPSLRGDAAERADPSASLAP